MFVLSRTPRPLAVGGEDRVHRPRRESLLDAEERNVELGFEGDAGCSCPAFGDVGKNPRRGRSDIVTSHSDQ